MKVSFRSLALVLLALSLVAGCSGGTDKRLAEQERRITELEEALAAGATTTPPSVSSSPSQPSRVPSREEGRALTEMMRRFGSWNLAAALVYTMPPRVSGDPLDAAVRTFIDRGTDPDFLSDIDSQWLTLVPLLMAHCSSSIDRLLDGFVAAEIAPSTASGGQGWTVSFYVLDEAGDRCSLEVDPDAEPTLGTIYLRQS